MGSGWGLLIALYDDADVESFFVRFVCCSGHDTDFILYVEQLD